MTSSSFPPRRSFAIAREGAFLFYPLSIKSSAALPVSGKKPVEKMTKPELLDRL
jgi:hypothetical protein